MSGSKRLKLFGISALVLGAVSVVAITGFIESLPTSMKHLPCIEPQNPVLVTPRGPVPLTSRGDRFFNRGGRTSVTFDLATADPGQEPLPLEFRLWIGILGGRHGSIQVYDVGPETDSEHIRFPDEAFCQRSGGKQVRLAVRRDGHFRFDMPRPLSEYDFSVYDGTMSDANAARVRAGETDTHFFSIPILVGSERHEIRLGFRVGVEAREAITSVAVGGMGA
jgi:hypothetical protein